MDHACIAASITLLGHGLGATEVRALPMSGTGSVLVGYFNDISELQAEVDRIDGDRRNIYIGVQPRPLILIERSPNRLGRCEGGKRGDIETLTAITLDLDPERPKDTASTDAELQCAIDRADLVCSWFESCGWLRPVRAMSGNGAQVWVALPSTQVNSENRAEIQARLKAFEAGIRERFSGDGVSIDSTHDLARITKLIGTTSVKGTPTAERPHRMTRFLDAPDRREDAALLAHILALDVGVRRSAPSPVRTTERTTSWGRVRLEAQIRDVLNAPHNPGAGQDGRNVHMNRAAFAVGQGVASGNIDEAEALAALEQAARDVGLSEAETKKILPRALHAGMGSPTGPAPWRPMNGPLPPLDDDDSIPEPPEDDVPPPGDEDCPITACEADGWRSHLIIETRKDGTTRVRPCGPNALLFVRHHPELAGRLGLNERSVEPVWLKSPPWGGETRPVRESDADELALWLAGVEHVVISREQWWHSMTAEAELHPFDLVRDWLASLKWDGQDRLSWWLAHRCAAVPTPFVVAAGRAWMISVVARTFSPGCQVDHMLVLEGDQGVGKTTVLRELAGAEWYAEITVSDTKDSVMSVHGPLVVEWAELAGISKKDAETVKSFVSRRVDWVRLPYARRHGKIPRRCVFSGSTNEGTWQTDPTGGRRYWPVHVGRCDIDGIQNDREQLWAEAVASYRAGEHWWLDGALAEDATAAQEQRYEGDPWEDRIAEAVGTGTLQLRERVTTIELLQALDVPSQAQGPGTGRRLSRIMRRLGWTQSRWRDEAGTLLPRGYVRSEPVDPTKAEAKAKIRRLRGI